MKMSMRGLGTFAVMGLFLIGLQPRLGHAAYAVEGSWNKVPVPLWADQSSSLNVSKDWSVRLTITSRATPPTLTVSVYGYLSDDTYEFGRNFIFDVSGQELLKGGKHVGVITGDSIQFIIVDAQGDLHRFLAAKAGSRLLVTEQFESVREKLRWMYSTFFSQH